MTFHPCYLSSWLKTEPGALLVNMECTQLKRALSSIHGNYLIQIGGLPELSAGSSIRFKWFFNTEAKPGVIQVALDELPLIPHSVDAIVLIHVLEFIPKPQILLREVYQALAPGGQLIIVNLNPWSLWGLKHGLGHDHDLPWSGHFWSMWQIKHWLHSIGFRIVTADTFCFRPPLKKAKWWRRLLWMEAFGSFCFPMLGGFFIMTAQKRKPGMITKEAILKKTKLALNGKLEPTTTRTTSCHKS